jgi:FixJ family two-component response regulator
MATYGLAVRSLPSAEDFLGEWQPDIVGCLVLDIRMAGISGLTLQGVLQQRHIDIPIIFVTGHGDVHACRSAFKNGAMDFLVKPVDEHALMDGIQRAIAESLRLHAERQEQDHLQQKLLLLSTREQEVLQLMLAGHVNKQIAEKTGLSARTVEKHRASIYKKLEVDSLAQLALAAPARRHQQLRRQAALAGLGEEG